MMGPSISVVSTTSLLPSVKTVARLLGALLKKREVVSQGLTILTG